LNKTTLQKIFEERVDLLYENGKPSNSIVIAASLVMSFILFDTVNHFDLFLWLSAISCSAAIRLVLIFWRKSSVQQKPQKIWYRYYALPTALISLCWAWLAMIGLGHNLKFDLFVVIFSISATSLAIPVLVAFPLLMRLYFIPALLVTIIYLFSHNSTTYVGLAVAMTFYVVAILRSAHNFYHVLLKSLELRFENEELATTLKSQYKKTDILNSKLESEIAERRASQQALEHHKDNLEQEVEQRTNELKELMVYNRTLFNTSPTGLLLCEMNGTIKDVNQAFLNIIGYTEEEAKALSYWELTPQEYERQEEEQLRNLQQNNSYGPYEKEYIRKDKSRVAVRLNGISIEQNKTPYIWSSVEDITEQKAAELQLYEAKESAEKANKAKSHFLSNMSHEIRTPMNAVIGMTHLALQTPLNTQQKNYISKAHLSAENLRNIIDDILDFSKIEAGRLIMEKVNFQLKDVIKDMVNLISIKAEEKGIQISVHIDKDVPRALIGDPLRLSQVLINIGSNGVKFSKSESKISLSVKLKENNQTSARLIFIIKDNGIGMTAAQQSKLFKPFSQADTSTTRQFGGTGLGLVISRSIVEMMNGEISLESTEGVGSTFFITVNLGVQQQDEHVDMERLEEALQINVQQARAHLKNAKILLVEDNEINLELAEALLIMNGMRVESAVNGKVALAKLASEDFDGVLMDCQMPVMDGYEASLKIREQEQLKDLPVIAMTANAMEGDKEKALAAGMNDHIAKPIIPEIMLSTIAKWVTPRVP
jgi:PAS domain S-box-containing protein